MQNKTIDKASLQLEIIKAAKKKQKKALEQNKTDNNSQNKKNK